MAKIKDSDYLCLSARLWALEASMLTPERVNRLIDARTDGDAARVLEECGYRDLTGLSPRELETALAARRAELFADAAEMCPSPDVANAFRLKYDCHNVKTLVKAEAQSTDLSKRQLLSASGSVSAEELRERYYRGEPLELPAPLGEAAYEAKETLARTGDGQLADLILDEACFDAMLRLARRASSTFLEGYARLLIDGVNLRTAVRCLRQKRDGAFLRRALLPGGTVEREPLAEKAAGGESLAPLFASTLLAEAAVLGDAAGQGGSLAPFERLCDNAQAAYLAAAAFDGRGERTTVAYFAAVESELAAVRLILTGRASGLSPETLRERMRDLIV